MNKVGIVFQKYNPDELKSLVGLDAQDIKNPFMNVEVSMDGFNSVNDLLLFLNNKWNKREKLLQLLPIGFIYKLGTTVNNSESEYSEFKDKWRKIERVDITENYGAIKTGVYWVTSSDDFPEQSIEIIFCSTDTLDEIIKDSYDYEWSYVIYFDGDKFKVIKENSDL